MFAEKPPCSLPISDNQASSPSPAATGEGQRGTRGTLCADALVTGHCSVVFFPVKTRGAGPLGWTEGARVGLQV